MFDTVEIPYKGYWSSPFVKWQSDFQHLHSIKFASHVSKAELASRNIAPTIFDHAILGHTIPQWRSFWGAPWMMSMIGAPDVPGPTIAQACQTGPRSLIVSANEVENGMAKVSLVVTCDRASNGAFVSYPGDGGPGGVPETESWVIDNFSDAPHLREPVLQAAENVAQEWGISLEEQNDVVLRRYEQYADALASEHAFQKGYMTLPFQVPDADFKKVIGSINGDVGIYNTTRDNLERLGPVQKNGTVTYAAQTHPADGNASIILTTSTTARELSADPNVVIRIISYAQGRSKPGYMPYAPVPATRLALERAGLTINDIDVIKTHNPFVVNDIVFAKEMGIDVMTMNNFGSSLVYGHPQGSTGTRLIIELIEELANRGGGYGLYNGCAAGDSGFATIFKVSSRDH